MAVIARLTTWSSGDVLTASDLNAEFNNVVNDYNGGITNANIAAGASIAASKLSGDVVSLTGTQTLTNKTLTNPTFNGSKQTLTTDNTGNFDVADSNVFTRTFDGTNGALGIDNVATGKVFFVVLRQSASGNNTATWWAGILWTGATAPTLTSTANRYDIFAFIYNGTNYFGSIVGQNYG